MEELIILKYQVEQLENTLRGVANVLGSRSKETCLDREVMKSIQFVDETLKKSKTKNNYYGTNSKRSNA